MIYNTFIERNKSFKNEKDFKMTFEEYEEFVFQMFYEGDIEFEMFLIMIEFDHYEELRDEGYFE